MKKIKMKKFNKIINHHKSKIKLKLYKIILILIKMNRKEVTNVLKIELFSYLNNLTRR